MVPTWIQKLIKKLMDFWIAPGTAPGFQRTTLRSSGWSVLGPRGGAGNKWSKPFPKGKRGSWEEGFFGRGAPKPPVAQRAGGILQE